MKNTLLKVWGIVLTLAILSGLLMATVPVSAADLSWSTLEKPAVTPLTTANVFDVAADGKIIYVMSNGVASVNDTVLYKSTNGGYTWTKTGLTVPATTNDIMELVVSPKNANLVLVTDGANVFMTEDGGVTWDTNNPPAIESITNIYSIDVSYNSAGSLAIVVGYNGGAALCINNRWYDTAATSRAMGDNWGDKDCLAIGFSPNYANDSTIMAVATDTTDVTVNSFVFKSNGSANWNEQIAVSDSITDAGYNTAKIAFASDYSPTSTSLNKIFFSLADSTETAAGGDVYRFAGKIFSNENTRSTVKAMDCDNKFISSLAFKGTLSSGTLAVGCFDETSIYTIASVSSTTSFTWNQSGKDPRYDINTETVRPVTHIAFSPNAAILYAGTNSAPGSAFCASTDYSSFDGIGLISVSAIDKVLIVSGSYAGAGAATRWVILNDSKNYMLFQSTDSGKTWKEVYDSYNYITRFMSPAFATDSTIYLVQKSAGVPLDVLKKSYDGGKTWDNVYTVEGLLPYGFAPIDGTNYWIATASGIRSSSNADTTYLDGVNPAAIIALPGCILVWDADFAGGYGEWFYSIDNGATFVEMNAQETIGNGPNANFTFGFDGKNWTVYMVDSGSNIQKYVVGIDSGWSVYKKAIDLGILNGLLASISNNNSVWYFTSVSYTIDSEDHRVPTAAPGLIYRTTDWKTYQAVSGAASSIIDIATIPNLSIVANTNGAFDIYTVAAGTTVSGNVYKNKIMVFTDSLLVAPTTVAPAADAKMSNNQNTTDGVKTMVSFAWNSVPNAKAYEVQVANDVNFTDIAYSSANQTYTITGNTLSNLGFLPGKDYYWRVRVAADSPMLSNWSTAVKFSTLTTSSTSTGLDQEGRIYPTQGAVITSKALTFTWGTVPGASTYEIKVSKNGVEIASQSALTTTVYQISNLESNTAYTWSVRAISGGIASDWVTSAFTTADAISTVTGGGSGTNNITVTGATPVVTVSIPAISVPQATVNVTVPPSTTSNTTPAWAWIVIAIGAVLVIAVIVLIVRTRKV